MTLRGANLTGVDLSRRVFKSSVPDLTGVNLTNAKLGRSDLSGVTLTGANLTGVDLTNTTIDTRTKFTGANLTGVNLTGKNLTGFTLSDANLTNANLTDANLTNVMLANTNLTGANLTRANFTGANLITTIVTGAVWNDTACPRGGKSSTGCSSFATQPSAAWTNDGPLKAAWYLYRSPATGALPQTPLLATSNAPLYGANNYGDDLDTVNGAKGTITNNTGQRIVVELADWHTRWPSHYGPGHQAILEPGAEVPYVIFERGTLKFYKAPEGLPIGDPVGYMIHDPEIGYPDTWLYPAGSSTPVNPRLTWFEQESHYEIWGSTKLFITREKDGWTVPLSDEFKKQNGDLNEANPRAPGGSTQNNRDIGDYAVFTIKVESL